MTAVGAARSAVLAQRQPRSGGRKRSESDGYLRYEPVRAAYSDPGVLTLASRLLRRTCRRWPGRRLSLRLLSLLELDVCTPFELECKDRDQVERFAGLLDGRGRAAARASWVATAIRLAAALRRRSLAKRLCVERIGAHVLLSARRGERPALARNVARRRYVRRRTAKRRRAEQGSGPRGAGRATSPRSRGWTQQAMTTLNGRSRTLPSTSNVRTRMPSPSGETVTRPAGGSTTAPPATLARVTAAPHTLTSRAKCNW